MIFKNTHVSKTRQSFSSEVSISTESVKCVYHVSQDCRIELQLLHSVGIYFWTVIEHSNRIHFLHLFTFAQKRSLKARHSLQENTLSIRDTKFLILLSETQEIKETQRRSVDKGNCRQNVLASQMFETIFTIVILRHCRWQHI